MGFALLHSLFGAWDTRDGGDEASVDTALGLVTVGRVGFRTPTFKLELYEYVEVIVSTKSSYQDFCTQCEDVERTCLFKAAALAALCFSMSCVTMVSTVSAVDISSSLFKSGSSSLKTEKNGHMYDG